MKRRVLLAGVGLSSIGVGAAFGSGAFTTIEADRNVDLNVSNDSAAQIALKEGTGTGAGRLIKDSADTEGDIEVIKFDQENLNRQSKTIFNDALTIKNNTTDLSVDLYVSETAEAKDPNENVDISNGNGPIDFQHDGSSIIGSDTTNATEIDTDSSVDLDIVINLLEDDIDSGTTTAEDDLIKIDQVTFVVEAKDPS